MIPIQPLIAKEPGLLAVLSPLEMFIVYLKLSLVAAIVDLPDHLVPGLVVPCPSLTRERTARRLPVLVLRQRSVCARRRVCFSLVLPTGLEVLHGIAPAEVEAKYSTASYFGLVTLMVLAFGLVFDLPVLMVLLAKVGISRDRRQVPTLHHRGALRRRRDAHTT